MKKSIIRIVNNEGKLRGKQFKICNYFTNINRHSLTFMSIRRSSDFSGYNTLKVL